MKHLKLNLKLFVFIVAFVFCIENVAAQEVNEKSSFSINAVGLSLGWYNPSLDYWKEKSEFTDAGFGGAVHVRGFLDIRILKNLHGQVGIGYWQSSVEEDLQGFGNTKLLITGIPVSIDFQYYLEPLKFSIITPYIGAGGEFSFIQHKLNFEEKENPDPETGSTFLGNGAVGIEARLSENFTMGLDFKYKLGNYNQEFRTEVTDPENPALPIYEIVDEKISLNGPYIGISFKYLI